MNFRFRILLLLLLVPVWARGQELRSALPLEDGFLAAGECLAWLDAEGNVLKTHPVEVPLVSLAESNGQIYALDTLGREVLRLSSDGEVQERDKPPVVGRLRALASNRDMLMAVTDAGEILTRYDGRNWKVVAFNMQYAGYYPRMSWTAVAAGGGSIMVAGVREDGTPAAFVSSRGTVWSQREVDYPEKLDCKPVSLSYDELRDRFCLTGTGGVLLEMPGCSHCNSLKRYPVDTLYARACSGFKILLLGSDGFRKVE